MRGLPKYGILCPLHSRDNKPGLFSFAGFIIVSDKTVGPVLFTLLPSSEVYEHLYLDY